MSSHFTLSLFSSPPPSRPISLNIFPLFKLFPSITTSTLSPATPMPPPFLPSYLATGRGRRALTPVTWRIRIMAEQEAKHLVFLWLMCVPFFFRPCFISWKWYHTNQNHRTFKVQSVIERAPLRNWQPPHQTTTSNSYPRHHIHIHTRRHCSVFLLLLIMPPPQTGCGCWKGAGSMPCPIGTHNRRAHIRRHTLVHAHTRIFINLYICQSIAEAALVAYPHSGDASVDPHKMPVTCRTEWGVLHTHRRARTHTVALSHTVSQRGVRVQQTAGRVTDTQPASQMACSTLLQSDLRAFVLACSITLPWHQ